MGDPGAPPRSDGSGRQGHALRDVLADRRIRRLLTSDTISGSGDALYWLALIVVLAEQDSGTTLVAAAVVARLSPRLLFGVTGGAIADRFDRRRLLMVLDASRAGLMVALTVAVAVDAAPAIAIGIVAIVCTLGTPYRPAVGAAIPRLVDEDALAPTNALWSAIGQAIGLIGPVAGLAILAVGPPWVAFAVNAVSFGLSVWLVNGTGDLGRSAASESSTGVVRQLSAGARAVAGDAGLVVLLAIVSAVMMLRGFELVLHVRIAEETLGLGATGYGWISAALGVGALLATPWVSRVGIPARPGAVLLVSALAGCVSLAMLSVMSDPTITMLLMAIEGAGIIVFEVASLTLLQLVTRHDLLGRVIGIQNAASGAAKLAGAVAAPALVAAFGLQPALAIAAALVTLVIMATSRGLLALLPLAAETREQIAPIVRSLAAMKVFRGVRSVDLQRLALTATPESVAAGTDIIVQGDAADDFYVVVSGELLVTTDGIPVNEMRDGDSFGEIGLVEMAPRSATVTAVGDVQLWRFAGSAFLAAVTARGGLPDQLVDEMSARSARSRAVRADGSATAFMPAHPDSSQACADAGVEDASTTDG